MGAFNTDEAAHPLFAKHQLTDEQKTMFSANDKIGSDAMKEFDKLPASREASLAKTKIEEAIFWANRSVITWN